MVLLDPSGRVVKPDWWRKRLRKLAARSDMRNTRARPSAPTGDGRAAINGGSVMIAGEVNGVIAALRESDIQIVSHNHLTDEEPRLFRSS